MHKNGGFPKAKNAVTPGPSPRMTDETGEYLGKLPKKNTLVWLLGP